ncbi:hypothetical protein AVEN_146721-1 [Araneus ventricosus]|uniref:Uncharacterized protein n=1 Tax=Araneus ventricosus TaxID=182803 RepID=A0A4Y2T247_ARAVE|nr:hypothetical protein AVEN_146721-1 [Araneus ventricosus]
MTKTAPELVSPLEPCALNQWENVWPLGMIMCNRFHARGRGFKRFGFRLCKSPAPKPRPSHYATTTLQLGIGDIHFNYILFELNKWPLPGLQKQRTMAKCIASEAEHRALFEDKKETILHLP